MIILTGMFFTLSLLQKVIAVLTIAVILAVLSRMSKGV